MNVPEPKASSPSSMALETSSCRRKSRRPRKLKRSYSPTWKPETRVTAVKKKKKPNSSGNLAAIANRPYDKLPNGEPFSCAMCKSPYVSKPANRAGKTGTSRSVHMPYPKARTDPVTGLEVLICNPCSQTFEKLRQRRLASKAGPTEQDVKKFLDEAKATAEHLAGLYREPEAARLYCPGGKNKICGCLERTIKQSGDAMADRITMLVSLRMQARSLREQKCYPLPADDLLMPSMSKTKAKKIRNVGLGNGHKKSKAYEEFVIVNRQVLKEDLGLCERATQRVLLYSNNFLFKKLKTEMGPRITRTKGKAALGQLADLDTIHQMACCSDNCVLMVLTHRSLLQAWRERAIQGQAAARSVLAEMLTPAGGYRLNCYKFISMITGCAKGTIQRVNIQMRETGGNRDPPIHGMKKIWLEQHRASTEMSENKKTEKQPHKSAGKVSQEVTSQSKPANNIGASSFKVWQNDLQQQQILKMQQRILEQQQQLLMQQQVFESALNQQRIVTSSRDQADKQGIMTNIQPITEQPTVTPGNVIQLQIPVQLEPVTNVQYVLKQPNQFNPVSNQLEPIPNQIDPVQNQLNPVLNQSNLVLTQPNQTQYEVVQNQNYSVYDPNLSASTPVHHVQSENDPNLIDMVTTNNQIRLIQSSHTFNSADVDHLNHGQVRFEVAPNNNQIPVIETQVQLRDNQVIPVGNLNENETNDKTTSVNLTNAEVQPTLSLENLPSSVPFVTFDKNNSSMTTATVLNIHNTSNGSHDANQVTEIQTNASPSQVQILNNSLEQNSNKVVEIPAMVTHPFQIQNLNENVENIPAMTSVQVIGNPLQQIQNQIELTSQLINATGNQYDTSSAQLQNQVEESSSIIVQGSESTEDIGPQAVRTFTVMYQNGVPVQAFLNTDNTQALADLGDNRPHIMTLNPPQLAESEMAISTMVVNGTQSNDPNQPPTSEGTVTINDMGTGVIIQSGDGQGLTESSNEVTSTVDDTNLYISNLNPSSLSTEASTDLSNHHGLYTAAYSTQSNENPAEHVPSNKQTVTTVPMLSCDGNINNHNTSLTLVEVDPNLQTSLANSFNQMTQWKTEAVNQSNETILFRQNSNCQGSANNDIGQNVYTIISQNPNSSNEIKTPMIGHNTSKKVNEVSLIGQNSSVESTASVIGQGSSNENEVSSTGDNLSNISYSDINRDSNLVDKPGPKKRWRKKSDPHIHNSQFKKLQTTTGKIYIQSPNPMLQLNKQDNSKETATSVPQNIQQTKPKSNSVLQSILQAPPKYQPLDGAQLTTIRQDNSTPAIVSDTGVVTTPVSDTMAGVLLASERNISTSDAANSHSVSHIEQTPVTAPPAITNFHAVRKNLPRILKAVPNVAKLTNVTKVVAISSASVGTTNKVPILAKQSSGNQLSSVLQGTKSKLTFNADHGASRIATGNIVTLKDGRLQSRPVTVTTHGSAIVPDSKLHLHQSGVLGNHGNSVKLSSMQSRIVPNLQTRLTGSLKNEISDSSVQ